MGIHLSIRTYIHSFQILRCMYPSVVRAEFIKILHRKGASAPTGRLRLRIVRHHEGGFDHFHDVVDGGTLEESHGGFVDDHPGAHHGTAIGAVVVVNFRHGDHHVVLVVQFVVDLELVLESGTATGIDEDPQEIAVVVVLGLLRPRPSLVQEPFDLFQTTFGDDQGGIFVHHIGGSGRRRGRRHIVHDVR